MFVSVKNLANVGDGFDAELFKLSQCALPKRIPVFIRVGACDDIELCFKFLFSVKRRKRRIVRINLKIDLMIC